MNQSLVHEGSLETPNQNNTRKTTLPPYLCADQRAKHPDLACQGRFLIIARVSRKQGLAFALCEVGEKVSVFLIAPRISTSDDHRSIPNVNHDVQCATNKYSITTVTSTTPKHPHLGRHWVLVRIVGALPRLDPLALEEVLTPWARMSEGLNVVANAYQQRNDVKTTERSPSALCSTR